MTTTVVFSGGPTTADDVRSALVGVVPQLTIAADSGLVACRSVGLIPDVVIGDMDSVPAELLDWAGSQGAAVKVYPSDKDATDLELALDEALALSLENDREASTPATSTRTQRDRLLVVGSGGGRLDHLLAAITLLGAQRYSVTEIEAWMGKTRIIPVHDRRRFHGEPGGTVTLLALHGPCAGVTTSGLAWPLSAAVLDPGQTLGVSNRFIDAVAEVSVDEGVVSVVIPATVPCTEFDTGSPEPEESSWH